MGNYADKLSYEERWDVIHYIRSCQAAEKQLEYSDKLNTLNPKAGIADSLYQATVAKKAAPTKPAVMEKKPAVEAPHTEGGASGGHSYKR